MSILHHLSSRQYTHSRTVCYANNLNDLVYPLFLADDSKITIMVSVIRFRHLFYKSHELFPYK